MSADDDDDNAAWNTLFDLASGASSSVDASPQRGAFPVNGEHNKKKNAKASKKRKRKMSNAKVLSRVSTMVVKLRSKVRESFELCKGKDARYVNNAVAFLLDDLGPIKAALGNVRLGKVQQETGIKPKSVAEIIEVLHAPVAGSPSSVQPLVSLLCMLDSAYLSLFYLSLLHLPSPIPYFKTFDDIPHSFDIEPMWEVFKAKEEKERAALVDLFRTNPLAAIHSFRASERADIFCDASSQAEEWRDALRKSASDYSEHEPICAAGLREYRSVGRTWPCHIYCYATLYQSDVEWLRSVLMSRNAGRSIEIGAGTGYLARLLDCGVECYDLSGTNEYHGDQSSYVEVKIGNEWNLSGKNLILSYPPPDKPMAFDVLRRYAGDTVVYIGEWGGLTGTAEFERELERRFKVVEARECASWGEDAAYVSVWEPKGAERQKQEEKESGGVIGGGVCFPPSCRVCGGRSHFRSKFVRKYEYCSERCIQKGEEDRAKAFVQESISSDLAKVGVSEGGFLRLA